MSNDLPLISCVMLTYNRLGYAKEAIQCFLNQTYTNKELVIVNNGTKEYIAELTKYINGNNAIKHITAEPKLTIGHYRNIGLKESTGKYIAVWDDDDLFSNDRLMYQYSLIVNSNVDAVMMMHYISFDLTTGDKEAVCMSSGLDGTILYKKPINVWYDPCSRGEDTAFVSKLSTEKYDILVVKNDPDMYTYRLHGGNITLQNKEKEEI